MTADAPEARGRGRSSSAAALLSFLWPGLGQLYVGKRRLAAVFAAPAVLVLLLLVYEMRQGPVVFVARFADPVFSRDAATILLSLGAWQLASVVFAFESAARGAACRRLSQMALVVMAVAIVAGHAVPGYVLLGVSGDASRVFRPNSDLIDLSTPPPNLVSGETQWSEPSRVPVRTPNLGNGRLTMLFAGVDYFPGRETRLYDSLMVVSYDPRSNSVQMVSVPRDSASFPLYFGGQVDIATRINSLPGIARYLRSPDSPFMTLVKEISYLLGIHIDFYAVMEPLGFSKAIDAVGGIDVVNKAVINDPEYSPLDGSPHGFYLSVGPHHLNGRDALAYVRSRKSSVGDDWSRAGRQQEVLISLLHKMSQPSQLLALPGMISALASSITTNFPSEYVAEYVAVGMNVPAANIKGVVLGYPYSVNHTSSKPYTSCLINWRVAEMSKQFFGSDSLWNGKPLPVNTCPLNP